MTIVPVDLSNCDREPIHIPGAIQPHGVLLVLSEPELTVVQASANADMLGVPVAQVVGRPLASVIGADSQAAVARALARERVEEANPLQLSVAGSAYDGLIHRHHGATILELERGFGEGQGD